MSVTAKAVKALLERPIAFHRILATVAGGALHGLFLSQCLYWAQRTDHPDGWFYKGRAEWEDETGMTRYEQESARKALRELGITEEGQSVSGDKSDRRIFYRVDFDRLAELIDAAVAAKAASVENQPMQRGFSNQCNGGKPTNALAENQPLQRGETSQCIGGKPTNLYKEQRLQAETTTETTAERGRAGAPLRPDSPSTSRGSRIPEAFQPDDDSLRQIAADCPGLNIDDATREFRDYWKSVAGSKGVKIDWQATWRNGMRRCFDQGRFLGGNGGRPVVPPPPPTGPIPGSLEDLARQNAERRAARDRAFANRDDSARNGGFAN